ncbi:MAG: DnaA ATPase domain-containing protein, partial [Acetobacteraceae bacterium]
MIASLWQRCISHLEQECEERDLNLWLRPLHAEERGGELVLLAPNHFVQREVERRFLGRIRQLAAAIEPERPGERVSLGLGSGFTEPATPTQVSAGATNGVRRPIPGNPIDPNYRFENFVAGPSNQMARAAALLVAEQPGGQYNPLFIYGGVGLGKTHLMHSLANRLLGTRPESRVA